MLGVHRIGKQVFYVIDRFHRLIIWGRGNIPNYAPVNEKDGILSDEEYLHNFHVKSAPWSKEYFTKVIISRGITRVGAYAFSSQTAIHEVQLPTTVTSIGKGAFKDCKLIAKFTLPNSDIELHPTAFIGVPLTALKYELGKDDGFLLRGAGLYHYGRKELVLGADTEDVILEDWTKNINPFAFAHHNKVKRVRCAYALESIGISAFEGCKGLEILMGVPEGCILGRNALRGTSEVKVAYIGEKTESNIFMAAISEHGMGQLIDGEFVFFKENDVPNIDPTPFYRYQDIVDLKAGKNFLVGLRANGKVIYSDINHYDSILDGDFGSVRFEDSYGFTKCQRWENVCQIDTGGYVVAGLRKDGKVYCSAAKDGNVTMELLEDVIYVEVSDNEVLSAVRENGEIVKIDFS